MSLLNDLLDPVTAKPRPASGGARNRQQAPRGGGLGAGLWRNALPAAAGAAVAVGATRAALAGLVVPDQPTVEWARGELGERWPTLAAGAGASSVAAGAVAFAEWHTVGRLTRRRRRLLFTRRWATAWPSTTPRLRRVRLQDGAITGTVTKPKDTTWEHVAAALDVEKGLVPARLRLDRRFGVPERVELQKPEANAAAVRRLLAVYEPLPMPEGMDPYEQPAGDSDLVIGVSYGGPVRLNLDDRPHLRVLGPSGYGKGYALRLIEVQALLAGWLLVVIDGGASPEHDGLDAAPTVLRPQLVMSDPLPGLVQIMAALQVVLEVADRRSRLCSKHRVDNWRTLPPEVRDRHPRVLVLIDEVSALVGGASKSDPVGKARSDIADQIDKIIRAVRKFGIHLVLADQITYAGTLSKGAQSQAPAYVLLGPSYDSQQRMVAGRSGLPAVVDHRGCGVAGLVGGWAREVRIPPNGPEVVARAVEQVAARYPSPPTTLEGTRQ